ncbi:sugar ABC transporter permease [Marispirochaeta aestuarii]|uniref:carbohydrate ABC transporter permease n=1 Tax=Marispirochaeta aestuarii TaxID=1963862 RepID=UPI0029C8BB29|nr:sugar ABC transporter permease [Marispirochaeta aestuarii]
MSAVSKFGRKNLGLALISPSLIILFIVVIVPVIIGLFMSLFRYNLMTMQRGVPFIGLDNYAASVTSSQFWYSFLNTIWWTVTNVAGQILFGLVIALLLNQKVKGLLVYKAAILIPWAIPASVAALNWMWLLHPDFGLINYLALKLGFISDSIPWLGHPVWARVWVVIARVWKEFPLSTIIFLAALQQIPKSLYEAAEMDGASPWKCFLNITLPFLRSSIVVASTLITIWTFNSFNMIWVMTKGGPVNSTEILSTQIYNVAFSRYNFGLASAQSLIMVSILLIIIGFYLYKVEGKNLSE